MSSSIKDFSLDHYSYDGIAKILHSKDRYKHLPLDVIDEIVGLANSREVPSGKSKLDVIYAYFEHALKHRAVKKFELTNKQKQLLFSSVQFLDLFLETGVKPERNVVLLHNVLARISSRFHDEIETQLVYARKQFTKIVNNEDKLCNYLVLASTMALYFAKDSDIDVKLKNKIIKLSNKIYEKEEKFDGDSKAFLSAATICAEFYANIEKKNALGIDIKIKKLHSRVDQMMVLDEFPDDFMDILTKEFDLSEDFINGELSKRDDFE